MILPSSEPFPLPFILIVQPLQTSLARFLRLGISVRLPNFLTATGANRALNTTYGMCVSLNRYHM